MKYDPDRNHRRSLRLADYDYSSPGAYFITICTQGREELLGSVANGELALSGHGQNVERCLRGLPARFSGVTLDVFAIMPNHVHFILWIGGVGAIHE